MSKGCKFDQGLEGTRKAFLRDGFKPASVAPILRRAGISKATLYTGFPDKRLLFSEVMQRECDRLTGAARHEIDLSTPAETVLKTAPRHISSARLSGLCKAVFRICAANAAFRISARPSTAPRLCGCATTRHRNLAIRDEALAADRASHSARSILTPAGCSGATTTSKRSRSSGDRGRGGDVPCALWHRPPGLSRAAGPEAGCRPVWSRSV
ncbi:TetR/AcrR family transcriptional regulator [Rhodovulum sulfidophilum]|uniref:TetR/AcrR family transcriptional regulator n=1 Tax=Rhodovulum sulfidophilum TaxID=35806 RepID=UPI0009D73B28|nr:TetR/AcrR family transcriptional regulator [Rhodovulum sulfidophilum]